MIYLFRAHRTDTDEEHRKTTELFRGFSVLVRSASVPWLPDEVRQKSHIAGALHGHRELSLVLGGDARMLPSLNTTMWIEKLLKKFRVFVINMFDVILRKITLWYFFFFHIRYVY